MIAVIFELWPNDQQESRYFDLAAQLRSDLDAIAVPAHSIPKMSLRK
jgi:hypothetical protein